MRPMGEEYHIKMLEDHLSINYRICQLKNRKTHFNAVVFRYEKKDQLCHLVTEMVSWSQEILVIIWLTRFIHDLVAVIDCSWAHIHSGIKAFNSSNLRDYFYKVD